MKRDGFTLVEIALALLVISVGMLALIGIFPTGLQINQRAIEETQAALFAQEVFDAIRAELQRTPLDQLEGTMMLPVPGGSRVWANPNDLELVFTAPNEWLVNVYEKAGVRTVPGQPQTYVDGGIRYRLELLDTNDDNRKGVRLSIRPGQFGPTEPTYVFYTEIYNHGAAQ